MRLLRRRPLSARPEAAASGPGSQNPYQLCQIVCQRRAPPDIGVSWNGLHRSRCCKRTPSFRSRHDFCVLSGYSPAGTSCAELARMRPRPTQAVVPGAIGRLWCGCRTVSHLLPAFVLLSLGIGACGANSSAEGAAFAGMSQAGGSSAGAAGMSHGGAGGAGSVGGLNAGGDGLVEVCLVCAGNGVGGHANVSVAGSGGSITTGAGGPSGGGAPGCGDRTCGPNQYCRAACSGVGSPSAGTGGRAAPGKPTCADLPAACSGVPTCSCICGPTSSFCTPGAAEVQCGCG